MRYQNCKCFICNELIDLKLHTTNIDHNTPLANKGKDSEENFAVTHESCNKSKKDADLKIARILYKLKKIQEDTLQAENKSASLKEVLKGLPYKSGIEKVTGLIHILDILSTVKMTTLASPFFQPLKGRENEKRINIVCQYIQKHATETLTIHKAAALIHLSPSAFCKFFKRMTAKTFSDYVNEIRITNVCNDLLATDKQVAEIAYENGFETLTYFNRIFLKKKNMSPSSYRKV